MEPQNRQKITHLHDFQISKIWAWGEKMGLFSPQMFAGRSQQPDNLKGWFFVLEIAHASYFWKKHFSKKGGGKGGAPASSLKSYERKITKKTSKHVVIRWSPKITPLSTPLLWKCSFRKIWCQSFLWQKNCFHMTSTHRKVALKVFF